MRFLWCIAASPFVVLSHLTSRRRVLVPVSVRVVRGRFVITNGVRLFCLEAGPPDGPLVMLFHGFPEIAYSWRHQIGPLGAAGFHMLAPI